MPGESQRRWSPLHSLQGNFSFREGLEGLSIGGTFGITFAWFDSHLSGFFFFVFFFFVIFFFFLASWLLDFKLSLREVEEEGEERGEEGKGSTLESL